MANKEPGIIITFSKVKQSPEAERKTLVKALSILLSEPSENVKGYPPACISQNLEKTR